jgi:peptidoglycan/xylan/chitin deacetylase (PgdA/CDA1 family)
MIRVAFRFDDPSATINAALEEAIFHALVRTGVPTMVAVIPFRWKGQQRITLDAVRAAHQIQARAAGTIEIALHGNSHVAPPSKFNSEFYGLPAAEQHDKLGEGLRQLREVFGEVVGGFVPPFNSYAGTLADRVPPAGSGAALRRHQRFSHLYWRIQSRLPQYCITTARWPRLIVNILLNRLWL